MITGSEVRCSADKNIQNLTLVLVSECQQYASPVHDTIWFSGGLESSSLERVGEPPLNVVERGAQL